MFEGGCREPLIARWPGRVPAGTTCKELAATIDILPTVARLLGVGLPTDRVIDGRDIGPLMAGQPEARSPHEAYYYYYGRELQAVRSGRWKLHFPHHYQTLASGPDKEGQPGRYRQVKFAGALYDLETDIGETTDVAARHPEVVRRLQLLAEKVRDDLGDSALGQPGKNVREPGRIP
jgi:arylsulfatase A-like enzyme